MLVVPFHGGQAEFGAHQEFLAAAELFDLPYDGALFRRVVDAAYCGAESWRVGVFGHGYEDLDVVGCGSTLELRSCLLWKFRCQYMMAVVERIPRGFIRRKHKLTFSVNSIREPE